MTVSRYNLADLYDHPLSPASAQHFGVGLRPDATGQEQTILASLSATPWTPLSPSLAIPDWATRAAITADGTTRYRLNGDPGGAPSTTASAGATMPDGDLWIVGLATGVGRTLGLTSSKASASLMVVWLP